jgi:hypothetical protein
MDTVSAASTEASDRRYRIAIGPHSGSRTLTLHDPLFIKTGKAVKASTADRDGFSLNAAVSCQSYQRDRLERLCRYVTRPAICLERLTVRADRQIQYELKNPFSDGTTHILFSPLDFLSKLAALVPRPRHNLVRYHGVFARGCHQYNAKIRKLIVPKNNKRLVKKVENIGEDKKHKMAAEAVSRDELIAPLTWAQRLKRVFNMMGPPSDCPMPFVWRDYAGHRWGPPRYLTDPDIIQKILDHIRGPPRSQSPPTKPATAIQSYNMLGKTSQITPAR